MKKPIPMLALIAGLFVILSFSAPAHAQATRTWVSGVGDDANPCSRTAPCKTFAGAISKTAAAGEINCLDPGGFGALRSPNRSPSSVSRELPAFWCRAPTGLRSAPLRLTSCICLALISRGSIPA